MNEYLESASENYFSQFEDIDFDKYFVLLFENNNSDEAVILNYLTTFADKVQDVELLFYEDENQGRMAFYDKTKEDIIGLARLNHAVSFRQLGYPLRAIVPALHLEFRKHLKEDTIREAEKFRDQVIEYGYFESEKEIYDYFNDYFFPKWRELFLPQEKYISMNPGNYRRWKEIQKQLILAMKEEGELGSRWKSEFSLYLLTREYFEDVEYQYRTDWLGAQSLDIYIPSIATGIEYQGIQHYQPVEHFGGEKTFAEGQLRDERKRELCKENGVTLIEWPYTVDVEANAFVRILSEHGIDVNGRIDREKRENGEFLDESKLIKEDSYVGQTDVNDVLQKAIEEKDINNIYSTLETEYVEGKKDLFSAHLSFAARNGDKTIANDFMKMLFERINALSTYRDNEELLYTLENEMMDDIVVNQTFASAFLSKDAIDFNRLVFIIHSMKCVSEEKGLETIEELLDRGYQKYEVEPAQKSNKRKAIPYNEYVKRKIGRAPEIMCELGLSYDLVERFCNRFGFEFDEEECFVRGIHGSVYDLMVGDVSAYNYRKEKEGTYTEEAVSMNDVTFHVVYTNDMNRAYFVKEDQNGTICNVENDELFELDSYLYEKKINEEMQFI